MATHTNSTNRSSGIGVSAHKLKGLQIKESRTTYSKVEADLVTYGLGVITK